MDDLDRTVQLEALGLIAADRARGAPKPLAAYLEQFPGFEEAVATAFLLAQREPERPARSADGRVGPFELVRELGSGGQGAVWLARDPRLGRFVALKIVPRSPLFESFAPRFEREARVASKLDHPGICGVLDVGRDERTAWIAMRFVEGRTLAQLIAARDAGTLDERLRLLEKVALAAHHAHLAGVVHRDLKPANVMVTSGGEPVVLDFGIARADDDGAPLTLTGDALGTPAYMSPEELRGRSKHSDSRADVWSLGVTAFETLTLRRPFDAPTREALARSILEDEPPDAHRIEPSLPHDLSIVLATALEKDLDRRYPSALEFAEELRRVREHEPIRARPASAALRVRRWAERNPTLAASTTALFAVLVAALAVTSSLLSRTRDALTRRDELVRDVAQLSDQNAASALLVASLELWPAREEKLAEMDAWLASAADVLGRREQHEGAHHALETRTDLDPDPERNAEARAWLREQLDELLGSLDTLATLRAAVAERRDRAATIRKRSIDDRRADWERATASVAADPRFGGFQLRPQVGLAPLGADSRSRLEEFAVLDTGEIPARDPSSGSLAINGASAIVLVLVPPAEVDLGCVPPDDAHASGSPNVDPWAARWDGPIVHAALDPYFIGKFEITQGQWTRHVGSNPSLYKPPSRLLSEADPARHPVETVSWIDAQRVMHELALTLCTEARWENAARAGTTTAFWTGEPFATLQGAANVADEFARTHEGASNWRYASEIDDAWLIHAPVGSFAANAFGLHDVHGNVNEWCLDSWEDLAAITPRAGDGFYGESESSRVQRGGSYSSHPAECRVAYRAGVPPALSSPSWGSRAARDVER